MKTTLSIHHTSSEDYDRDRRVTISPFSIIAVESWDVTVGERKLKAVVIHIGGEGKTEFKLNIPAFELAMLEDVVGLIDDLDH